ncbi:MAG: M48 family metalloprotease [Pseudomonadota bacterium]
MEEFDTFGEAIASTTRDCRVSNDDWSVQLANDAFTVLSNRFPELNRYRLVVLHQKFGTAFTASGDYIFVCRSLLELCSTVEMAAFVIAHEIAHHELGHIPKIASYLPPPLKGLSLFLKSLLRVHLRARQECEADVGGMSMCVAAGLDAEKCARALQIIEKLSLDRRAISVAIGSDAFYVPDMPERTRRRKIRSYLLFHGYYPVRIRRVVVNRVFGLYDPLRRFYL